MSVALRSEGWSVHPSFTPHGPTSPVTLLVDEVGVTQLAGVYPVAWQTPWGEMTDLRLERGARAMALYGSVGGVRYCWRHRQLSDYEDLRTAILGHGGVVARRQRRAGIYGVVAVVLLASFAGVIAAGLTRSSSNAHELADATAVNVTPKDLPAGWTSSTTGVLSYLFPPSNQVITSTTTTAPAPNSAWRRVSHQFQRCLGVSAARDRVYGAAGQLPDYQVSSPVFSSPAFKGAELASTTQYYATTTMVHRDVAEMSRKNFGACFVASSGSLILSAFGHETVSSKLATNWNPLTYAHGWARGGEVPLHVPGVVGELHLVMLEATSGHYEVTFGALVGQWPRSQFFLASVVSTLKSRMSSTTSTAV